MLPDYLDVFNWYWGTARGTRFSITGGMFNFVYTTMRSAGPTLTAENLKKGLFSAPAVGGATSGTIAGQQGFGKTVGLPYDSYALLGSDRALAYWNPDVTASTQAVNIVGKGVFMYMDGGKRLGYKDFSKSEPKFFNPDGAVAEAPIGALFPVGHRFAGLSLHGVSLERRDRVVPSPTTPSAARNAWYDVDVDTSDYVRIELWMSEDRLVVGGCW